MLMGKQGTLGQISTILNKRSKIGKKLPIYRPVLVKNTQTGANNELDDKIEYTGSHPY